MQDWYKQFVDTVLAFFDNPKNKLFFTFIFREVMLAWRLY